MKDIMGMMGKIKDMQAKMERMQEEIAELECEGTAGGGMVTVRLSGKGVMLGMSVDPSMFKEDDVEILEDLVVAAHNGRGHGRGTDPGAHRRSANPSGHETAVLRLAVGNRRSRCKNV